MDRGAWGIEESCRKESDTAEHTHEHMYSYSGDASGIALQLPSPSDYMPGPAVKAVLSEFFSRPRNSR